MPAYQIATTYVVLDSDHAYVCDADHVSDVHNLYPFADRVNGPYSYVVAERKAERYNRAND